MEKTNYKICDNIFITENTENDQVAVFNYEKNHWFKINNKAMTLIRELEYSTFDEINKKKLGDKDYNPIEFKNFIQYLLKNKYIVDKISLTDDENSKEIISLENIRNNKKHIYFSLTDKCNLKCIHCYNTTEYNTKILNNQNNIFKIIDRLQNQNVRSLSLTGGEPFLRKEIFEIIEHAFSNVDNVEITSNGILIDDLICKKLKASKINRISVSLDGIEKETHELFRGKNTYEKVLKNIRKLIDAGINTHIIATINRKNMRELGKFEEFISEMGATGNLSLYTPVGNGRLVKDDLMFSEDDFKVLQKIMTNAAQQKIVNNKSDDLEKKELQPSQLKKSCGAGFLTLGIEDSGRVVPCHLFLGKDVTMGNILEDNLDVIIDQWVNKNLVMVDDIDKCKTCSIKYFCGGGCLAHRYSATGKMNGVDPYCFMNKPHHERVLWNIKN